MILALSPRIPTYKSVASNWMRPDNMWRSNNPTNLIISCNTKPSMRPPKADHLPIVTILDLTISHAPPFSSHNMRKANFIQLNYTLQAHLETECTAACLRCKEDINMAADSLVNAINEALKETVPISKPSPYARCWWMRELMELKKVKNRLSNFSYKLHGIPEAPTHAQHKEAMDKFCHRVDEIKKAHWDNWLEGATSKDIYITNKFITSLPSDYANTKIPPLKTPNPASPNPTANTNLEKANELASVFFPPPPANPSIQATAYSELIKPYGIFSCDDI